MVRVTFQVKEIKIEIEGVIRAREPVRTKRMIQYEDWEQIICVRKSLAVEGIDRTETQSQLSKSLQLGLSKPTPCTSSTNLSNPSFSSGVRLSGIPGISTTESRPYCLLVNSFKHTNVKKARHLRLRVRVSIQCPSKNLNKGF